MSRKTAWAILLALSGLYSVVELVPERFAATDEVYFKAAGRNWAATGQFAAPELKGYRGDLTPPVSEVFFSYPPLYPFLFGVYTKVVGFGPRSCILYDVVFHLLLVWCGCMVAGFVYGVPWSTSVLVANPIGRCWAGSSLAEGPTICQFHSCIITRADVVEHC